jgi:hypothetical protein
MQTYVHPIDRQEFACLPGAADLNGTLALPRALNDSTAHGSYVELVGANGDHHDQYDSSEGLHLLLQPSGAAAWGDGGHLNPRQDEIALRVWDTSGNPAGDAILFGKNFAPAADPNGGALFAGDLGFTSQTYSHSALMYSANGAAPSVRWGPKPLASSGAVFGSGVDMLSRSLVITGGSAKFGGGAITGQWFDTDGRVMTGEFLLLSGFVPGSSTWFETSPLIGGGLVVRRMDGGGHAQALVTVVSGQASVAPAPDWMASRADAKLQIVRGDRAYAVLPYGRSGATCTQRLEIVAPDGTSCGSRDYTIASGACDLNDLTLGADGTVIQLLPSAMESIEPVRMSHTCTWRYWRGATK